MKLEPLFTVKNSKLYKITDNSEVDTSTLKRIDIPWSTVEMEDPNCRPPFKGSVENISQYDTVFVGFPIWWYVAPTIVNTFLEAYDFSNKKIIVFATSGGSGIGKTAEKLAPYLKGAQIADARVVRSAAELGEWIKAE